MLPRCDLRIVLRIESNAESQKGIIQLIERLTRYFQSNRNVTIHMYRNQFEKLKSSHYRIVFLKAIHALQQFLTINVRY